MELCLMFHCHKMWFISSSKDM